MSVVINGDTGISGVNGSAASPAIQGGDADTGIFFGTNQASISTSGSQRLFVDSQGRVGIGESSPDALLCIKGDSNGTTIPTIRLKDGTDTREAWISNTSGDLVLAVGDNDDAIDGQLKLFESGRLQYDTNSAGETLKILNDGTVSMSQSLKVADTQLPTAGALSHRNLVVNGSMKIAQRATSETTAVAGYHTVDRLKVSPSDSQTQSQISLTSADTPFTHGLRKAFRLQNSTVSTAGINTYREIDYRIEGQDIAQSGWKHTDPNSFITISFWLRASVAQSYYLYLRAFHGTAQAYSCELAVAANTWTKFEKTIPGNANITINSDNTAGLLLRFIPWYAVTYTGAGAPLNAWQATSSDYVPDMTNTWVTTLNSTFDITGFQCEVGKKATPFEHRGFGEELARCQRYFERLGGNRAYDPIGVGKHRATTQSYFSSFYKVTKRTSPSISFVDNIITTDRYVYDRAVTALTDVSASPDGLHANFTHTAAGDEHRPIFITSSSTTPYGYIDVNAEL